ncbi:MAG: HAD family hydrolase [Polaribacter sp.]|jgi:HAD superfamily hydrolase (TIGR01509 family)
MKIPNPINCVIFDMDGVIIDSEEIHKKAYFETFESLGLDVSEGLYKTLTGASTINAFQKLVDHFNLNENPEELVLAKRRRYVNYFESDPDLHLVDGVENLIKTLHSKEIKLVLASSSAMVNINRVFNRFDLNPYFVGKISGADLVESKPNPEIFIKAAEIAGVPRRECFVIEDSDNGVKAANDAGIFVFGYHNPLADDQTLENANISVHSFDEILKYLDGII